MKKANVIFKVDIDLKFPEKIIKELIEIDKNTLRFLGIEPVKVVIRESERGYHIW